MIDRSRNDYLNAGITPDNSQKLKRVIQISELLYGPKDTLTQELKELKKGCEEGIYNAETMTWKDSNGNEHSQRCNARKIAEDCNQGLPDGSGIY